MRGAKHTPNDIYMVLTNRAKFPVAVTMFDAADVPLVLSVGVRWQAEWYEKIQNYYIKTQIRREDGRLHHIGLHRFLVRPLPGMDTDHINNNSLDNRRQNLRAATRTENARNYRPGGYESLRRIGSDVSTNTRRPGRVQVWLSQSGMRWCIRVTFLGVRHSVRSAATREEALDLGYRHLDGLQQAAAERRSA
jgi:peptidoglycan/xylan/chitin deacetylase (PgdA/CDA1 family)